MTLDTSIMAKLLNVNGMHIKNVLVESDYRDKDGEPWKYEKVVVYARPFERLQRICPYCGKRPAELVCKMGCMDNGLYPPSEIKGGEGFSLYRIRVLGNSMVEPI